MLKNASYTRSLPGILFMDCLCRLRQHDKKYVKGPGKNVGKGNIVFLNC